MFHFNCGCASEIEILGLIVTVQVDALVDDVDCTPQSADAAVQHPQPQPQVGIIEMQCFLTDIYLEY